MNCRTILLLATSVGLSLGKQHSAYVKYQWNYLNFSWPSSHAHNEAVQDHSYVPENIAITGIKVWKDRMYLTLPRFMNGVPVTLASTSLNPINGNIAPLLEPFPTWDMQKLDDCKAFQFVQSMEIDTLDRMWVIENGKTEISSRNPRNKCPARLVIIDLENDNKILLSYNFPPNVVHMKTVHLNDIVLDHEDGGYAFITDSDNEFPGIIVFSLKKMTSWKVTHETMKADKNAAAVTINGTTFTDPGTVNGIVLSPASTEGNRKLYYSPFASYNVFSVPVNQLKNENFENVKFYEKSGQGGGMVMSSDGHIYFGLLNQDAVAVWNTKLPFKEQIYFQDHELNQYTDSFCIDKNGYLYWTINRLQKLLAKQKFNLTEPNFRVFVSKTNSTNYLAYPDGSVPKFPFIEPSSLITKPF